MGVFEPHQLLLLGRERGIDHLGDGAPVEEFAEHDGDLLVRVFARKVGRQCLGLLSVIRNTLSGWRSVSSTAFTVGTN
jgi:hypothetical protein